MAPKSIILIVNKVSNDFKIDNAVEPHIEPVTTYLEKGLSVDGSKYTYLVKLTTDFRPLHSSTKKILTVILSKTTPGTLICPSSAFSVSALRLTAAIDDLGVLTGGVALSAETGFTNVGGIVTGSASSMIPAAPDLDAETIGIAWTAVIDTANQAALASSMSID